MICLDNSVLRKFADPDPDPQVVTYLDSHASEVWIVPAIIAYEFYSVESDRTAVQRLQLLLREAIDEIRPFTDDVAVEAAVLEGSLQKQNRSLGTADLLSAATAREAGATFVTADKRDFDKAPLHELLELDIIDVS
ncbi:plasmid stability protein StbB [Halosimplex carlsbadense 2-9-1]|uniref:Ribonuclease VapC n=1 Tax=Halosimplex carlsbadense 2-9-1 TaxID=797114 RepID=M0CFC2_9EURY|nr:type II toxin-antitoxin system VapC family toxin [Halosimplex carlsbadense]ELZ20569.1 plasmid stability protein StbB [Halosimplex carlsbadense 2-9-1]